ncbi:MAG: efflux RND transporter periplasmic adaptor subunit [Gammaproteobacteria bacterium]|nr:efflux RND transporter periplasmic adaptor subunit [Gammaproteobacteria bacterium]
MRQVFTLVSVIGLAAAGWFGWRYLQAGDAPRYETVAVTRGDIEKTVTALGSLQPNNYVDVGAQVTGQLLAVHVDIGDTVTAGQLLAEIDPTVYASRVRADRARLADLEAQRVEQRAQLVLARQQDERNRNLLPARAVSEDLVQQSTAAVKVGEARLDSLAAQIDQARSTLDGDVANLGYTKIYAPMAGTVVAQTALAGQTLNAVQSAPTLLRIADLQTMTVKAQVAEADVTRLEVGMPVYFTTLGDPDRRWESKVRQILPTPEILNEVVLYNVLIDADNDDGRLMTDMTAQVFFVLGRVENVAVLPVTALRNKITEHIDDDHVRVQVLGERGLVSREATLGLSNRSQVAVVAGLAPGEHVVIGTRADDDDGNTGSPFSPFGKRRK